MKLISIAAGLPNGSQVKQEKTNAVFKRQKHSTFYAPGLKGPRGESSNQIVCLSVRLSVRNSVPSTN